MARIAGMVENQNGVQDMVAQFHLNHITAVTVLGSRQSLGNVPLQRPNPGIPAEPVAEYGARLHAQRCRLLGSVAVIDLALVPRAFRAGNAIDSGGPKALDQSGEYGSNESTDEHR